MCLSHLSDGCYRVLRCVVPPAPVGHRWHLAGGGVQDLLGSAGWYLREPEHGHKQVEGRGEDGGPQRAPGPQQDQHEDHRVQGDFIPHLQHRCPLVSARLPATAADWPLMLATVSYAVFLWVFHKLVITPLHVLERVSPGWIILLRLRLRLAKQLHRRTRFGL